MHGTIGNINRGKYTFVNIPEPEIKLPLDRFNEFAKYSQATRPAYENRGYGIPSLGIFAIPPKIILKTIIFKNGLRIAHEKPKTVCLYSDLTSRNIRK